MKHSLKVIVVLLGMFFLSQLIGIAVNSAYSPKIVQQTNKTGEIINVSVYNLPYGVEPPQETSPGFNFISVLSSLVIAIFIMFLIMKLKAELILRWWFFIVIVIGLGISLTALLSYLPYASGIALLAGLYLSYLKVFKRSILVHNFTEVIIYPGISAVFVPFFNIFFFSILLIIISAYDIYAVWHSGFMQKMAKYQMNRVKVFAGFLVPYLGKKEKEMIEKLREQKKLGSSKKVRLHLAILGGGDVLFPIVLAGIVLQTLGFLQALIIALGATISLAYLFYISKKGKFYPAMPFITIGCFIALGIAYLVS